MIYHLGLAVFACVADGQRSCKNQIPNLELQIGFPLIHYRSRKTDRAPTISYLLDYTMLSFICLLRQVSRYEFNFFVINGIYCYLLALLCEILCYTVT